MSIDMLRADSAIYSQKIGLRKQWNTLTQKELDLGITKCRKRTREHVINRGIAIRLMI